MKELFRDTVAGHLIRLVTKSKILPYEEERDPSLWKNFINREKSARIARQGHTGEPDEKDEEAGNTNGPQNGDSPSRGSSDTQVAAPENTTRNEASGVMVDPEKGRDATIVTWFSDDDPEVCSFSDKQSSFD